MAAAPMALALGACRGTTPGGTPDGGIPEPPAGRLLANIVDDYFEAHLKLNPVSATFIGDHRYDDRLPAQGAAHVAATRALEQRFLDDLGSVDPEALSPADRLTYEVFAHGRRLTLENTDWPGHLLPLDQLMNPAGFFAQMGSGEAVQPFATAEDYERFAARMAQFPAWTGEVITSLREGVKRGIVQPCIVVERLLPQIAAHATGSPEESIFWRPVTRMPATIAAEERTRLTALYRTLIGGQVIPAYRQLHEFLRDKYLPLCRDTIAWSALPQGDAWYRFLARAWAGTDTPVEDIHETGLREIARLDGEITAVMKRLGLQGDVAALAAALREDRRFRVSTADELLDTYRALETRVNAAVPRLFTLVPKAALDIRPMEAFRAPSAPAAEYYPPSADGSRPGIFYVNTHDLPGRPTHDVETIFLHEAIPGHHFQVALAIENPQLPRFRRFGSADPFARAPDPTTGFVEGWALYAESLGEEFGLFTDPYQKLGQLFAESWRAARLVVDTGIHARGWSRVQAIDYMLAHTAASHGDAMAEVERYIALPGQALAYKTGQMTIRRLHEQAGESLGPRFDLRAFHAALLEDGALPLAVLEAKMQRRLREITG